MQFRFSPTRDFLTHAEAVAIYTTLRLVGAPHGVQEHFICMFTNPDGRATEPPSEWRFQGLFGYGGKFYLDWDGWRVSCYSEDESEKTNYLIKTCNELLHILREQFISAATIAKLI